MTKIRKKDFTPLFLLLAMSCMWMILHALAGGSFAGASGYNTYTLQALAWRSGSLHLPHDYPHLELAIFEGEFYVSFPPLPSVILFPLTFIFGTATPDNLLVKMYAAGGCILMYYAMKQARYSRLSSALFAFFFAFASSCLPMTLNGAVWYHAQVLAFFLITASVCLLAGDHPTSALLCYALSVACRPFHALYAIPLFFIYWIIEKRANVSLLNTARRLAPGIFAGLCVAAAIGLYNFARFGNPFEFGHNYLPEFSFQGGTQFSVSHVLNHLKTFVWGLPLEKRNGMLAFKQFGYSAFIACPTLLIMLIWTIRDLFKKQMRWEKLIVLFTFFLHFFLLLLHRTFGGYQLGARYTVDLIPYSFLYLLLTPEKCKLTLWEGLLLGGIFLFTCWGITQIHI